MNTLQKSWKITWKNKILWVYGLILSVIAGFFIFIDQTSKGGGKTSSQLSVDSYQLQQKIISDFAEKYWAWIIVIMLVSLVIFGIIIWTSIISKIGLIHETGVMAQKNSESQDSAVKIKRGWKKGREKFWQVIGLDIMIAIAEFVVIFAVKTPLNMLYKNGALTVAIPLTIFAVLILVPFILMFLSIQILGARKIILDDRKIFQAISESYDIFTMYWKKIVATLLLFILAITVSGFLYTILCAILLLPVAVIALVMVILMGMGSGGLSIGLLIFAIPAIPFSIFFAMLTLVLQESVWSVLYQKIK